MSLEERLNELPLWAAVAVAVRSAQLARPAITKPIDYVTPEEIDEAIALCAKVLTAPAEHVDQAPYNYGDHAVDAASAAGSAEETAAAEAIAGMAYATASALEHTERPRDHLRERAMQSSWRAVRATASHWKHAPQVKALIERAEAAAKQHGWTDASAVPVDALG